MKNGGKSKQCNPANKNDPRGAGKYSTFDCKWNHKAEPDKYADCMTMMAKKARMINQNVLLF